LEEKNALVRKANPNDKRHTCIYLSAMTKENMNNYMAQVFYSFAETLTSISEVEQSKVLDGLIILNKLLEKKK
jgi:DNA-binding MarR family transcriptional regulator